MRNNLATNILIGIGSGLVTNLILFVLSKYHVLNVTLPLWVYLIITCLGYGIFVLVLYVIKYNKIQQVLKEYKEGSFGDSYVYTWEYKKSKGKYSIYGYEPCSIRLMRPLSELNNEHTITYGHEVSEENIKRIIQLSIFAMVDKTAKEKLMPTIDYLLYTETMQFYR